MLANAIDKVRCTSRQNPAQPRLDARGNRRLGGSGGVGMARVRRHAASTISGLLNAQAAAELGIFGFTHQIHRSKVMHKRKAAVARRLGQNCRETSHAGGPLLAREVAKGR